MKDNTLIKHYAEARVRQQATLICGTRRAHLGAIKTRERLEAEVRRRGLLKEADRLAEEAKAEWRQGVH